MKTLAYLMKTDPEHVYAGPVHLHDCGNRTMFLGVIRFIEHFERTFVLRYCPECNEFIADPYTTALHYRPNDLANEPIMKEKLIKKFEHIIDMSREYKTKW
jgi:hypothetical protein